MKKLNAGIIRSHLNTESQPLLSQIHVFEQLDSTNSWLLTRTGGGEVCLAEQQSMGKGRRGNSWVSPATGNIYLSLSWLLKKNDAAAPLLGLITGISVCDALENTGVKGHGLKWPNDIYADNRKLGGILVEACGKLERVVIGIGLNISPMDQSLVQQPCCSLAQIVTEIPDRNQLVACLLDTLLEQLRKLECFSSETFLQQWKRWDIIEGRQVRVLQSAEIVHGIAEGIDARGQIGVRLANGELKYFHSAEISLRW